MFIYIYKEIIRFNKIKREFTVNFEKEYLRFWCYSDFFGKRLRVKKIY